MARKKEAIKRTTPARKKVEAPATRGGTQRTGTAKSKTASSQVRRKPAKTNRFIQLSFFDRLRQVPAFQFNIEQKIIWLGMFLVFIMGIMGLSLLSPNQGRLTATLSDFMWRLFGWGGGFIPLAIGSGGLYLIFWGMGQPLILSRNRLTGVFLLFLTIEALATVVSFANNSAFSTIWEVAQAQTGGGWVGSFLVWFGMQVGGIWVAMILWVVAGLGATLLISGVTRAELKGWFKEVQNQIKEITARKEQSSVLLRQHANPVVSPQTQKTVGLRGAEKPTRIPSFPVEQVVDTGSQKSDSVMPANQDETPSGKSAPKSRFSSIFSRARPSPSANWQVPRLDNMLNAGTDRHTNDTLIDKQANVITQTLESFGAPVEVVDKNVGPTIIQFGVKPLYIQQRSGKRVKVKVGKIASLADDLALALAAKSIRIQAPVPGKGYVGIEVPNSAKAVVSLRNIMESESFAKVKDPLRFGIGENVAGQPVSASLAKMPHLLIAGATGAGKSVCVNGIIACLLLQYTPDELRFVMVDPKRVELTGYNGIPHLIAPVVVDMDRVVGTLQWAMREMDNRYRQLAEIGARNIVEYNKKIGGKREDKLPYIVIIIDELADLMMMSPEDTEKGITRLAQMARATGIHMIIATQRPSVDVVTGLIKANFPARIAFAVSSGTDSRVILDTTGAERLLGQGDMLFQSPDAPAPVRLQGCYVSEDELGQIIKYWQQARRQNRIPAQSATTLEVPQSTSKDTKPNGVVRQSSSTNVPTKENGVPASTTEKNDTLPTTSKRRVTTKKVQPSPKANGISKAVHSASKKIIPSPPKETADEKKPVLIKTPPTLWEDLLEPIEDTDQDELLGEAVALIRKLNKASTSLLQRRFRIGYTRAARLIDAMEERNIVGPPTGTSKAREVLSWEGENNESV